MINLLLTLLAGAAAGVGCGMLFGWVGGVIHAVIATAASYILLNRRIGKRLEAARPLVEKHIAHGRVEEGVKALEALRPLARYQRMVARVIDGQIGMLLYAHGKDPERARPFLERGTNALWQSRAMYAALLFRRKKYDEMTAVFERTLRRHRKTSLLWSAWAWCEWKRGRRERAIEILARAQKVLPSDEAIGRNLLRLSNEQKIKMNGYGTEWWALRLEDPPQEVARGWQQQPWARQRRRA